VPKWSEKKAAERASLREKMDERSRQKAALAAGNVRRYDDLANFALPLGADEKFERKKVSLPKLRTVTVYIVLQAHSHMPSLGIHCHCHVPRS
jgi:hypothetical protein